MAFAFLSDLTMSTSWSSSRGVPAILLQILTMPCGWCFSLFQCDKKLISWLIHAKIPLLVLQRHCYFLMRSRGHFHQWHILCCFFCFKHYVSRIQKPCHIITFPYLCQSAHSDCWAPSMLIQWSAPILSGQENRQPSSLAHKLNWTTKWFYEKISCSRKIQDGQHKACTDGECSAKTINRYKWCSLEDCAG